MCRLCHSSCNSAKAVCSPPVPAATSLLANLLSTLRDCCLLACMHVLICTYPVILQRAGWAGSTQMQPEEKQIQPDTTLTPGCLPCRAGARAGPRIVCLPGARAGPCYRACTRAGPCAVCLPSARAGPCCRACADRHTWERAPAGSWHRARAGPTPSSRGCPSLSPRGGSRGGSRSGGRDRTWGSCQRRSSWPWRPNHKWLSCQAGCYR